MNKQQIIQNIKSITIALILVLGVNYVSAAGVWNPAPSNPPSGNVDAPINVGNSEQTRLGPLILGSTSSYDPNTYKLQVYGGPSYFQNLAAGSVFSTGFGWFGGDTNGGGVQIGTVNKGYYGDATNLAARVSTNGGAFYIQNDGASRATYLRVGKDYSQPALSPLADFSIPVKATGGLIIETRTTDPSSPETGRMWLITN